MKHKRFKGFLFPVRYVLTIPIYHIYHRFRQVIGITSAYIVDAQNLNLAVASNEIAASATNSYALIRSQSGEKVSTNDYVFYTSKGNKQLADAVNFVLERMRADGSLDSILDWYLSGEDWVLSWTNGK